MSFLSKFYEEIKLKCRVSEIVSKNVTLTKKGPEYIGLCPFHNEKSPSFTVNDLKGFYHCFGCGVHGDVIKFISERYKLQYQEAAIKIAQENGIEIQKLSKKEQEYYKEIDLLYSITEMTSNFYQSNITKEVKEYLTQRSIKKELIEKFEIGYAPPNNVLYKFLESKNQSLMLMNKAGVVGKDDNANIYDVFRNRLIFPIRNAYNKVIGFGGRVIGEGMPKYINSPDNVLFHKKASLYAENIVASTCYKTNNIIVVEGYFDVISMHSIGLTQTVASLGTAVTKENLIRIFKMVDEVIICMDGDDAGTKAIKKIVDHTIDLATTKKIISFVTIPYNLDPDNFIKRDGKDAIHKLIDQRISFSEMILKIELDGLTDGKPESKALIEKNLDDIVNRITDKYLKQNFSTYFKNQIWKIFNQSKKTDNNKKMHITIPELVSNISVIEKTMLYYLVENPILIKKSDILSFFSETILENKNLESLKNWVLNEIDLKNIEKKEKLIELIKNSYFANALEILLKDNYIIPNFDNEESKLDDFWNILYMKHNLVKIKQEYFNIISNSESLDVKILKGYESEISRLVKKIDVFTNKILMS